jgi:hypothetical protein
MFTRGCYAVVAAAANACYVAVIKAHIAPCNCIMAVITLVIGCYMLWRHAGRTETIVTGITGAYNRGMVNSADTIE